MKRVKLLMGIATVLFCLSVGILATRGDKKAQLNVGRVITAEVDENFDIVAAKQQLAREHADELESLTEEEIDERLEKVNETLFSGDFSPEMEKRLNEQNAYVITLPEKPMLLSATTNKDYQLDVPKLIYSSSTGMWGVLIYGHFTKEIDFESEVKWLASIGTAFCAKTDVGGFEEFGFVFENVRNSYSDLRICLKETKAYVRSENSPSAKFNDTTTNAAYGKSGDGIGFEMQDYIQRNWLLGKKYSYNCNYMGCIAWYSQEFVNYDAQISSYYYHTYSKTKIQSFELCFEGKSCKPKASFTNDSMQWKAYPGCSDIKYMYNNEYRRCDGIWYYFPSYVIAHQLDDSLWP